MYLFPVALSILLKSLTVRIPITVNNGKSTWRIHEVELIHIFECNHEEAGTRMVLHAYLTPENVVAAASDTDVLGLMIYAYLHSSIISKWTFRCGKG